METIHVNFDELTAIASEHDYLEPKLQRFINHNSSAETINTPSKEDLDNFFIIIIMAQQQQAADVHPDELCPPNNIAASAFVPWIYMAQFWHSLKEDGSKHRLKFLLDRKELTLTLDDFRTIFHLP
ncbi:hypothetical protein Tco_0787669 [Tanacetum coccineum]